MFIRRVQQNRIKNGTKVAEGRIDKTQPGIFSVDDLADVGVDEGTLVTDYGCSSKFN